ncbi:MAG TPA: hypothetical protein VMB50_13875 [Myxococcales bacterium]|nr:hypothetical protein [Myxococcales bacterium]
MSRRKPKTKLFNKRYGKRVRTDLQQQRNEAVLKASEAEEAAKKKGAAKTA